MPDQLEQKLAKGREFLNGFQHELDRFEQYELNLLQDDRKERETRMLCRFPTLGLNISSQK